MLNQSHDLQNQIILSQIPLSQIFEGLRSIVREEMQAYQDANKEDRWLTAKEVCTKLGISSPTLSAYCKSGVINKYHIGSRVRFKESEIEAALRTFKKYSRPSVPP